MTKYFEYGVNLSEGQKTNLAKAIQTNSELTLRLKNNQLRGSDELMLTKTQLNKIQKAASNRTGVDVNFSKTQIRKAVKQGGSLFSSLAGKSSAICLQSSSSSCNRSCFCFGFVGD